MHSHSFVASALLCSLLVSSALAGSIYRWSDEQGQIHFSDIAPDTSMSADTITPAPPSDNSNASGLRPAERELLLQMERRSQQQAQQARASRLQTSHKRAEQWERCEFNREKLHESRGRNNYKQYSRYLRNHCW